ncbi:MAG: hypothetical protein FJZ89_13205, partial [Chloroflexi bacterium]|nr:hypothetical protein [Chloroflexota bacterium]
MNNAEIVAWIKKIETRIDRLMIRGTTSTIAPAPGTWVEFLNVGSPSTSATYGEVHASGGFVFGALSYITAGGLVVTGGLGVTGGASITGGLNVGSATGAASGQVKASAGLDLAGSKFVVDSSGNLTAVNNVAYSWPAAQGGATTYLTNNGSGTLTWATTATTTAHNVLSATHGDTAAGTVVRGDIIYGNSTPAWARLAVGAANAFLRTDGTDTGWSSFYLTGTSGGTTSLAVT